MNPLNQFLKCIYWEIYMFTSPWKLGHAEPWIKASVQQNRFFLNIIFQIKWEPVNFFISILVPNLLVPLSTPLLLFNLNMDQNKNFITTTLFILKYYIPDKMRTSQPNLLVPLSTPLLIFILNKDQSKKKYWGKVTHDSFLVTLDTY